MLTKKDKEKILNTVRRNEYTEISQYLIQRPIKNKKLYNRTPKHKNLSD